MGERSTQQVKTTVVWAAILILAAFVISLVWVPWVTEAFYATGPVPVGPPDHGPIWNAPDARCGDDHTFDCDDVDQRVDWGRHFAGKWFLLFIPGPLIAIAIGHYKTKPRDEPEEKVKPRDDAP